MPPPRNQPPGCFWAFFLVIGLVVFAGFFWGMVLPVARAHFFFVETRCTVLDKRLGQQGQDGWRPEIHIQYEVNGQVHQTWTYDAAGVYSNGRAAKEVTLANFVPGRQYPCWYDPDDPDRAVLVRGFEWWILLTLLPLVFVVVGTGGLVYSRRHRGEQLAVAGSLPPGTAKTFRTLGLGSILGFVVTAVLSFGLCLVLVRRGAPPWAVGVAFFAPFVAFAIALLALGRGALRGWMQRLPSAERLAAKRAAPQDRPGPAAPATTDDWPTVPAPQPSPQPAATLAVRLAEDSGTTGSAVACLIPFTAIWLGCVIPFVVQLTRDHARGRHNWGQTLFAVPFVLIGLGLAVLTLAAAAGLIGRLLAGRLLVELSEYPLAVGGRYELWAFQSGGALPLRTVRIRLVCAEWAQYRQGTSTSTSTREVYGHDVLVPEAEAQGGGLAGGVRRPLDVPAGAMHSFAAGNNKISWSLQVRGRAGVLPVRLSFPVVVYPTEANADEPA